MTVRVRIALVEPGPEGSWADRLETAGADATAVASLEDLGDALEGEAFDAVVWTAAGDASPAAVVDAVAGHDRAVPVVVAPRAGSEELATEAFRAGAADYVPGGDPDAVVERVRTVIDAESRGVTWDDPGGGTEPTHPDGRTADVGTVATTLSEAIEGFLLATTTEEIARIAVETASETLDLPVSAVFRRGRDGSELEAVATTEAARVSPATDSLDATDSPAGRSIGAGETRVFEGERAGTDRWRPSLRTELHAPIGDRWLLLAGSTERRTVPDYQTEVVELLATATAAALRRASRDAEMRRYETVFRAIDEPVCVLDVAGEFRMANRAAREFLYYESEELVGTSAVEVVEEGAVDAVTTELLDLEYGESATIEVDVRTGPEERHPCDVAFTALPPEAGMAGVVAAIHDVSIRKRVESELAVQRDRFSKLFEHVPDPVVETDIRDGVPIVRGVNAAFEDVFGFDESTVRGKSLNRFVRPPDGTDRGNELDRRAAAGELVEEEVRRETRNGIRYFLFRGIPVDVGGEDGTTAFGVYTDITEQRLRERRLSVLNRIFRHNIRNDMNVVMGRAGLLAAPDGPANADHADAIRTKAADVVELAETIQRAERTLDRADAPRRPLDEIIRDAADRHADRDASSVTVDVAERPAHGIDERVEIAVEELIDNAITHADGGSTSVVVALETDDDGATIAVRDDGPGIPPKERAVFERQEETQLAHGSGVGLWLVTWLVTTLGGEVAFGETDAGGTEVRLRFPAGILAEPAANSSAG